MLRTVCKGKIHRATVTQADLNDMDSVTIDKVLMDAADIRAFEIVQITNLSTGTIWQTYAIEGTPGSGTLCLNGPPARHFHAGDKVIILSLSIVTEEEWARLEPRLVYVDDRNQILSVVRHKTADP